jgi:nucleoside triphosphatase
MSEIVKKYPLPAVAALIAHGDQVLLVRTHKWSGFWGIPGGKIEYGENALTALHREMREEVGLEIRDAAFAFFTEIIEDPKFHKPAHFISLEYVAYSNSNTVNFNEEIAEFAWLTIEQALEYPINEYTKRLLEWCIEHQFPNKGTA